MGKLLSSHIAKLRFIGCGNDASRFDGVVHVAVYRNFDKINAFIKAVVEKYNS